MWVIAVISSKYTLERVPQFMKACRISRQLKLPPAQTWEDLEGRSTLKLPIINHPVVAIVVDFTKLRVLLSRSLNPKP